MITTGSTADAHLRYFVSDDAHGEACLWAEPAHNLDACDVCGYDYRFPFGPNVILMKEHTEPVVWDATCRMLIGARVVPPPFTG